MSSGAFSRSTVVDLVVVLIATPTTPSAPSAGPCCWMRASAPCRAGVHALDELRDLLVAPARQPAALHRAPRLRARDDEPRRRPADDADRFVAGLAQLPVVLPREVGEHGPRRGGASALRAHRGPGRDELDRVAGPVPLAADDAHGHDRVRAGEDRLLLEAHEREPARLVPCERDGGELLVGGAATQRPHVRWSCHPTW